MCGAIQVLACRLGTVVAAAPAAGALRWWVTAPEAAAVICAEIGSHTVPKASNRHSVAFGAVNIAHGDGHSEPGEGSAADAGDRAWAALPAAPPISLRAVPPADGGAVRVLMLGGSGLLGPDVVRCLAGDVPGNFDPGVEYSLLITDGVPTTLVLHYHCRPLVRS